MHTFSKHSSGQLTPRSATFEVQSPDILLSFFSHQTGTSQLARPQMANKQLLLPPFADIRRKQPTDPVILRRRRSSDVSPLADRCQVVLTLLLQPDGTVLHVCLYSSDPGSWSQPQKPFTPQSKELLCVFFF